ncbi:MAG: CAP domain-containing protein [Anaerolineae bacterium]
MLSSLRRFASEHPALAVAIVAVLAMGVFSSAMALAAPPGEPISPIEQELVDAVNAEREKHGLHPLIVNYSLMEAAYKHTDHMADIKQICHNGCGDGTVGERIAATGYKWITYGENVAYGQPTVEVVMNAWMNSPGHRANILGEQYTDIGVGHIARGGHYWTQVFGAPVPPPEYVTVTPPAGHGRPCELAGDLDYDGVVTRTDVDMIRNLFMVTEADDDWNPAYDMVEDGIINVYDIYEIANHLGDSCG